MDTVYVGIDPGTHTGMATWRILDKSLTRVWSTDFWDCVTNIRNFHTWNHAKFFIEAPQKNPPVFSNFKAMGQSVALKIAQDIGRNKCMAELLIQYFEREKISYEALRPTKAKWDAATFKRITGWQGRTNSHMRDAGRIVFGR